MELSVNENFLCNPTNDSCGVLDARDSPDEPPENFSSITESNVKASSFKINDSSELSQSCYENLSFASFHEDDSKSANDVILSEIVDSQTSDRKKLTDPSNCLPISNGQSVEFLVNSKPKEIITSDTNLLSDLIHSSTVNGGITFQDNEYLNGHQIVSNDQLSSSYDLSKNNSNQTKKYYEDDGLIEDNLPNCTDLSSKLMEIKTQVGGISAEDNRIAEKCETNKIKPILNDELLNKDVSTGYNSCKNDTEDDISGKSNILIHKNGSKLSLVNDMEDFSFNQSEKISCTNLLENISDSMPVFIDQSSNISSSSTIIYESDSLDNGLHHNIFEDSVTKSFDDEPCCMQTMVEGSLQPLTVVNHTKAALKESILFAGVSQEMNLLRSLQNTEAIEGVLVDSIEDVSACDEEDDKQEVHLMNLTEPLPVNIEGIPMSVACDVVTTSLPSSDTESSLITAVPICSSEFSVSSGLPICDSENVIGSDTELSVYNPAIDNDSTISDDQSLEPNIKNDLNLQVCDTKMVLKENEIRPLLVENKPTFLKVLPIKNGHELWDIDQLYSTLANKGSVLLKLCSTSSRDLEQNSKEPLIDFVAQLVKDFSMPEENDKPSKSCSCQYFPFTKKDKISDDSKVFAPPVTVYEIPNQTLPAALYGRKDFMEKLQRASSPMLYEDLPQEVIWKGYCAQTTAKKRKSQIPPFTSVFNQSFRSVSSVNARGRRRGRPPSHNKGNLLNERRKSNVSQALSPAHFSEESTDSMDMRPTPLRSKPYDPHNFCPTLASLKDGKPLNKTETNKREGLPTYREKSVVIKKIMRIPCEHCNLVFRKKTALLTHIKMRHKSEKKCPVCQEVIKMKGKFSMKTHLQKVHKNVKPYKCDQCNESFQLNWHLRTHKKETHEPTEEISDEESDKEVIPVSSKRSSRTSKPVYDSNEESENEIKKKKKRTPKNKKTKPKVINKPRAVRLTRLHSQEEKSENESGDSEEATSSSSESEIEEAKRYFCKKCNEGFSHMFKLRHHRKGCNSNSPKTKVSIKATPVNSESSSSDNEESDDDENHVNQKFSCKSCSKICRSSSQLDSHMLQHKLLSQKKQIKNNRLTKTPKNKSNIISNKFYSTRKVSSAPIKRTLNLRADTSYDASRSKEADSESEEPEDKESKFLSDKSRPNYVVIKGRRFHCNKCNVSFMKEKFMIYHLKKIHETLYPFRACPHCSRVFRSSGPYMRHLNLHKVQKCPVEGCKAKFKALRMIKKHQKNAHPDIPFRCSRCIDVFKQEDDLIKHNEEFHKRKELNEEEQMDDNEEIDAKENDVEHELPSVRRTRNASISYKETTDDEKHLLQKKRLMNLETEEEKLNTNDCHSSLVKRQRLSSDSEILNPLQERSSYSTCVTSVAKIQQKDSSQIKFSKKMLKKVQKSCQPKNTSKASELVRTKRPYNRKVPVKKGKANTSWTAALKAKYRNTFRSSGPTVPKKKKTKVPCATKSKNLSSKSLKTIFNIGESLLSPPSLPMVYQNNSIRTNNTEENVSGNNMLTNNPCFDPCSPQSILSPAITDDVVRRVSESLLNRQQEKAKKVKKEPKKSGPKPKKIKAPANSKSKLTRIPFGQPIPLSASMCDDSLSGFAESCHADQFHSYGVGPSVNVPEDDDGSAGKVIRFDSF